MRILWAAALALAAGQEKNEAEELFRKMEAKLLAAKTLSFKVTSVTQGETLGRGRLEGTVALEPPKKARALLEGAIGGEARKILLVADGKEHFWTLTGFGDNRGTAPEKLGANVATFLARADLFNGIYMGAALEWAEGGHDASARIKVSGFKLGAKEKVGEVEAQRIEFRYDAPEIKAVFACTLWIDPKTLLPLKRALKALDGQTRGEITETYTSFKVDEPIDAATFRIGK